MPRFLRERPEGRIGKFLNTVHCFAVSFALVDAMRHILHFRKLKMIIA